MSTPSGDIDTVSAEANLKQAVLHRLVTSPGSYAFRPGYGVGLKDFQNAPNLSSSRIELMNRIQSNFADDDRIASLDSLAITQDDDKTTIELKYTPRGFRQFEQAVTI